MKRRKIQTYHKGFPQRYSTRWKWKQRIVSFRGYNTLEKVVALLMFNPLAIREPVQVNQHCCDMTWTRFWNNHTHNSVLNMLKETSDSMLLLYQTSTLGVLDHLVSALITEIPVEHIQMVLWNIVWVDTFRQHFGCNIQYLAKDRVTEFIIIIVICSSLICVDVFKNDDVLGARWMDVWRSLSKTLCNNWCVCHHL